VYFCQLFLGFLWIIQGAYHLFKLSLKILTSVIALFLDILDELVLEGIEPIRYHIRIILSENFIHFLMCHYLPFLVLSIFLLNCGIASQHTVKEAKAHLGTTSFFY